MGIYKDYWLSEEYLAMAARRMEDTSPAPTENGTKAFYILWCPSSTKPPKARFDTEDHAHAVADKMAATYNETVYVLRAVEEIRPVQTVTTRLA